MAKRKTNPVPLIAFGVLVLVAAVAGAVLYKHGAKVAATPQVAEVAPPLPGGPLQLLETRVSEVRYLATDGASKTGNTAQATVLIVGKSLTGIEQKYALLVRRETIDCSQQRIFNEHGGYYGPDGKLMSNQLLSGTAGRPVESADVEVVKLCGQAQAAPGHMVTGYRQAQREVQTAPDDIDKRAKADPKDAETWAWLCAAGARGRWHPTLPTECDHAVSLQPKSSALISDRGFLKLVLGRNPAADADFVKAEALDPQNAVAIFGRSLVAGMRGDLAASKRDRAKALAIDPQVAEWIEANYRFQIRDDMRK